MKIYVMRHGTTVWNEKGITQGHTNNRLSKNGQVLTKEVAFKFKDKKIDVIFVSPLMRTMQTANLMNVYHKAKIVKDDRLIEIDQGIFTGRSWKSLTEEEKVLKSQRAESCGMETYRSVFKRVESFINDLKQSDYKNVLIITHNVNASLIYDLLSNIKVDFNNENHLRNFNNAEIKSFDI